MRACVRACVCMYVCVFLCVCVRACAHAKEDETEQFFAVEELLTRSSMSLNTAACLHSQPLPGQGHMLHRAVRNMLHSTSTKNSDTAQQPHWRALEITCGHKEALRSQQWPLILRCCTEEACSSTAKVHWTALLRHLRRNHKPCLCE